ncbi:MAG: NUDIX hydrolase [Candidatus Pacebacteria bacterium]|nr:NUDIX hydrolase [Candidatus Paceibacterota bacterium]MCD8563898.1 NUDIX hydrolase [Candidatus Paceibacterota bacterium]
MNTHKIFNEENYSDREISEMRKRHAVRSIIINKNKEIALIYYGRDAYYSLPGGGVHGQEDFTEACIRESREETGCVVRVEKEVGETYEIRGRSNVINITKCFVCGVVDQKEPILQPDEEEKEMSVIWCTQEKAQELILKNYASQDLYDIYCQQRDFLFLQNI